MKNSFARYVLLVPCLGAAFAQIFGTQTQYSDLNQRRQLTPTQQGHILSDIQQHQHRFNLHQNVLNNQQQTFPPQQFGQRILNDNYNQFVGQPNQASFSQNRQLLNPINAQPQILSTQQTLVSTNQPLQTQLPTQSFLPGVLSSVDPLGLNQNQQPNRLVQHHTQTAFTPNYKQQLQPTANPISQISAHQHLFQVTSNPLFNVDQSQPLDPEKQKERFKELQEKQAIIDKHNEFVEKQYEKALKKAQSDHLDFIKDQQDQKKKLYLKIYKDPGNIPRYRLNNPRYIYPEETELFNAAVQRYYQEHPTTTTTTTTTPGPSTTTADSNDELDSKRNSGEIFLSSQTKLYSGKLESPTAPSANLKPKSIQSLDDLEELKNRYESQQINKDDLIAQLKLAIGEDPGEERNLTSREISLPDGRQVEIVRTADPKLPPGTKSPVEKFTLPNGQEVQVIRTADPNFSTGGDLDELVRQKLNLPGGQNFEIVRPDDPKPRRPKSDDKYEIIKTTDPKLATKIEPDSDLDRLVQAKLNLPDGDKYEIIGTGDDPKSIPKGLDLQTAASSSTTVKPPTEIFQELTEGVVPPGANFQILRHDNGGLEQINGLPSTLPDQKKVTFVLLEEQNDGSFKVQGVKGNGAKEKDNVDVDSILQRIKEGDIKLPPPSNKNQIEISKDDFQLEKDVEFSTETSPSSTTTTTKKPDFVPSVLVTPNSFPSDVPSDTPSSFASNAPISTIIGNQFVTESTYPTSYSAKSTATPQESFSHPFETSTSLLNLSPTNDLQKQASTISHSSQNSIFTTAASLGISGFPTSPTFTSTATFPSSTVTIFKSESSPSTATPPTAENGLNELPDLLKKNGLFAMAKFLRQSGLDTILNETGPYTIFAPNDKAFRTLLVQLGGPDKAEEKFRDNPRLLSGLLLHHVIPGAFKIGSLQDEMTGVSLAGTQLRVNQYNMHDAEWNDVKITTINGAKVLEDKRDIEIPQGVAHAVDRVMFPLPVGDIMQTLQSDRERRFTSFLRALFSSDLAETLQGTKTFTLFAPTDRAFAALSGDDLTKTLTDKKLAKELVMRHITPGTLYTNGMRYYQIKDSLDPTKIITISKTGGKIKVNDNPIATQNIPTTNGVIHAVDVLL